MLPVVELFFARHHQHFEEQAEIQGKNQHVKQKQALMSVPLHSNIWYHTIMLMNTFLIKPLFSKHLIQLQLPKRLSWSNYSSQSNNSFCSLLKARVITDKMNAPSHTKHVWSEPKGLVAFMEFTLFVRYCAVLAALIAILAEVQIFKLHWSFCQMP